ncbi:hypothetical protein H1R20_g9643, partial [Candolleomyces eurysporus]
MSSATPKINVPALTAPLTASSVKAWLDCCEDAFEVYSIMHPDCELKASLKILLARLKMEAPEASQWWGENWDTLKVLTTYADFTTKVTERFIPSGWKMDALATFYVIVKTASLFPILSLPSKAHVVSWAWLVWAVAAHGIFRGLWF